MARRNIDPSLWGSVLWDVLFHHAFHPADDEAALCRALECLPHVLPCASCRASCASFCKLFPPGAIRTSGAGVWLWTLKDTVNQKLKARSPLYPAVKRRYTCYPGGIVNDDAVLVLVLCVVAGADAGSLPRVRELAEALSVLRPGLGPALVCGIDWHAPLLGVRRALAARVGEARVEALLQNLQLQGAAVGTSTPNKRTATSTRG